MAPKVTITHLEHVCNVDNLPYLTLDQQILRAVVLDDVVMFDSLVKHTIKYARLSGVLLVKQTLTNIRANDVIECKMQALDAFLLHMRSGSAPMINLTTKPLTLKDSRTHAGSLNASIRLNDMQALIELLTHDAFYATISLQDVLKVRIKMGMCNTKRPIIFSRMTSVFNRTTTLIECYNKCVKQRKAGIKKLLDYIDYMNGCKTSRIKLSHVVAFARIKVGGGVY